MRPSLRRVAFATVVICGGCRSTKPTAGLGESCANRPCKEGACQNGVCVLETTGGGEGNDTRTLQVILLRDGPAGDPIPAPGVTVVLHDPNTNDMLDDRVTDAAGVADFGSVDTERVTLTIPMPDAEEDGTTLRDTFMLIGLETGRIVLNFDAIDGDDEDDGEVLATFDVQLTSVPEPAQGGYVNTSLLLSGGGGPHFDVDSSGTFTDVEVTWVNLDEEGRLGIVAQAHGKLTADDEEDVLKCGAKLDVDPATWDQQTLMVNLNTEPLRIPFTTTPPEPVRIGHNVSFYRKGIDIENVYAGSSKYLNAGDLIVCPVSGYDSVEIDIWTRGSATTPERELMLRHAQLAGSYDFELPQGNIDGLARTDASVSYTPDATAIATGDLAFVDVGWRTDDAVYWWFVMMDPSVTSVTLPELPQAFSDRTSVPESKVVIGMGLWGADSVNGFDDLIAALAANDGDWDALGITTQTVLSQGLWVLVVDPPANGTLSAAEVGIDCGAEGSGACFAENLAIGMEVTFTAKPVSGYRLSMWTGDTYCGSWSGLTCKVDFNGNEITMVSAVFEPVE